MRVSSLSALAKPAAYTPSWASGREMPIGAPISGLPVDAKVFCDRPTQRSNQMKSQVLSHAGLAVTSAGRTLVTDPWIIGSCYWRSWWNYPPVTPQLVRSLKPDFIYVTHIHWDHFQGPSLRKFDKRSRSTCPRGTSTAFATIW
jgi:hypothetical protein